MKKMNNPTQTQINKRSLARWAFAIVALAFMMVGTSAQAAPPANDNFANAIVIPASPPATVNGNNAEATSESGEPLHSDYSDTTKIGLNSVWWSWTPSASGTTTIDTINSGFDTELAVYTGGSVGSLSQVAVNEDGTGLANGWSSLSFNAVAGTTYHIAVAGYDQISGPINLNFSSGGTTNPPPTGLALTVNTTGNGTVTKDPEKTSYDTNDVVTLTANPSGTNTFTGWSGDIGTNSATGNPISIVMDGNKTITAVFTGDGGSVGNCGDPTSINVTVNGVGRVTPNLNGRNNLIICRNYRLTAIPGRDQIFAGWTGVSSNENNARLVFAMQPGMNITANFVPNPFLPVTGTYNGLFFERNNISANCSGYFTIKVAKSGRYTARFLRAGKTVTSSGTIGADGSTDFTAGRGTNVLNVHLQLEGLSGGDADKITGSVTTTSGCVAQLNGDRQVFSSHDQAPLKGTYTFVLPRNATTGPVTNLVVVTNGTGTNATYETNEVVNVNEIVINPGHSFGTITIDKLGRARIRGELADGSKINQSTVISKQNADGIAQIPFFDSLYRGQGLLIGWLNVTTNDVSGTVNWQKPVGGLLSPEGINADIQVIGSSFDKALLPSGGTTGVVEIGGNSIDTPLMIPVELSKRRTLVPTTNDPSRLSMAINNSGLVRGKYVSPVTGKITSLRGVLLQNADTGRGYFLAKGARGYFNLNLTTAIQDAVQLGAAADFAVLGGSTVANTGLTTVTGDLGVSPGTSITGFGAGEGVVTGSLHTNDTAAADAQAALTTAFNDAAGRTLAPIGVAGNIGGRTLAPGLYKSTSSLAISSGDLTLDAGGDPNAIWIFQIASTLTTTAGRQVILSGGAKASNVFWQVGTSATLGTTTAFKGTIMADQSITLNTGATLEGRALARIAAVTLDANAVTLPTP